MTAVTTKSVAAAATAGFLLIGHAEAQVIYNKAQDLY